MSYPDTKSQQGIDELRAILLGEDRQAMDGLREVLEQQSAQIAETQRLLEESQAEVARLAARVGDDESMRQSVSPVLAKSFVDVEASNPKPLARALAPLLSSSIKSEIKNSEETMIEALYPITGKLVAESVKNAVASAMETVNQRIDELTSARLYVARVKSWRTGEPISKYMYTEPGDVKFHSALLMDRYTGATIAQIGADGEELEGGEKSNLATGMLAALSNLTEEVFTAENDELRTVDLNGRKITLRRSQKHIVVVEFIGILSADQHHIIDQHFGEVVDQSEKENQPGVLNTLKKLMPRVEKSDGKFTPAHALLLVIGGVLCWKAFGAWQVAKFDDKAEQLSAEISSIPELAAYPIAVNSDFAEKKISVSGLIPEGVDPQGFESQWQDSVGADTALDIDLAPIADAARSLELERRLGLLRAENRVLRLEAGVDAKGSWSPLQDQLRTLLDGSTFVVNGSGKLVDSDGAKLRLRRVARLAVASNAKLMLIGQLPEAQLDNDSGPAALADKLSELGVSAQQMTVAVEVAKGTTDQGTPVVIELLSGTL